MASQIIVTKRFRQNVVETYEYISNTFSFKTASLFLDRIERRIDFIAAHPEAGKPSQKRKNVRCVLLPPHNQIYYRFENERIEILLLFDMRQNPNKNPY
ncbi:MAG: type II toxin-antitoxin system RelE/ParE family toxin [Ginsengibacter sp.]|jgi:plasmid stabilization system protein ParE